MPRKATFMVERCMDHHLADIQSVFSSAADNVRPATPKLIAKCYCMILQNSADKALVLLINCEKS